MQNANSLLRLFEDHLIFDQISEYLTIKEILNLSTVSKGFLNIVEYGCKHKISELNLNTITNKSSIHQMQFYFNRCLTLMKSDPDPTQQNPLKTFFNDPFKFEVIRYFEVGPLYTSYITMDHKARIFRTKQFIECMEDPQQQKKQVNHHLFNYVKDISCKAEQCVITRHNGEISLNSTHKDSQLVIEHQQILQWTQKIPIKQTQCSYNYCIFLPEHKTSRHQYLSQIFGIHEEPQQQVPEKINLLTLPIRNMLNGKYIIVNIPCEYIIDCTVGHKYAYFINQQYCVFSVDLQPALDQAFYEIDAKIFEPLIGKTIVKIFNGFNFYIALQREIDNLEDWNNDKVLQWMRDIGFQDFVKIAKVEQLNGKKLKNIQRKYMYNVLGITKQNMQQKFLMSINENLGNKPRNDKLYGWGKNQFGQLGSSSANYVNKPQRIRMNCLKGEQYIDSIFCGWFQTFVRTQKGRIYSTIKKIQRKKKKQQKYEKQEVIYEPSSEDDNNYRLEKVKKNSKHLNKKKKKQKGPEAHTHKEKNRRKFQEEDNWVEEEIGKAFFVQTYKNINFYLQCPVKATQNQEANEKSKKMRTAKTILDKILWSNVNKQDFKVGYMDKEMGLIEASAYEMEMFDVKQNRIKYFKKNDRIIWDRQQKLDLL